MGEVNGGRLVVRPGLVASIFNVGLTAAGGVLGILIATSPGANVSSLVIGFLITLVALVGVLNLVGMRVEADKSQVAKVYFFGWFRKRIPFGELHLSEHSQRNANLAGSYSVEDFKGTHTSFSMIPFYVWRRRDIRALVDWCIQSSGDLRRGFK